MTDTELIIELINTKIDSVNRTIASSAVMTSDSIEKLEKTIREHNGRLREVEAEQLNRKKVYECVMWVKGHWYVCAIILIALILILIPVADTLGIDGIITLLK